MGYVLKRTFTACTKSGAIRPFEEKKPRLYALHAA
jgi:hypothetical protein